MVKLYRVAKPLFICGYHGLTIVTMFFLGFIFSKLIFLRVVLLSAINILLPLGNYINICLPLIVQHRKLLSPMRNLLAHPHLSARPLLQTAATPERSSDGYFSIPGVHAGA